MLSSPAIALSGMNTAQVRLQASAHNIANLDTVGFRRQQVVQGELASGGVGASLARGPDAGNSMATDMVGLLQAKSAFLANLAVFRASDRMMGSLLDVAG